MKHCMTRKSLPDCVLTFIWHLLCFVFFHRENSKFSSDLIYLGTEKTWICWNRFADARHCPFQTYQYKILLVFQQKLCSRWNQSRHFINQTLFKSRLETPPSSGVSWLKWKVVLNLKNLSVADSGSYWCQAENIVGTVQRQTPLNVTTRPITPSPSGRKWLSKHAEANGLCYFRNPLQTIC